MTEPMFKKYTDLIPAQTDLVQLARNQTSGFDAWLDTVTEPDSLELHAPYSWTLREVVNHLSDCERVFAFRALWIARGGTMPMPGFDENEFSRLANAKETTLKQLRAEFLSVRAASLSLMEGLSSSDWHREGTAWIYDITVEKQFHILVGHVEHHWNILKKRFETHDKVK